jgi:hypothetical protein
VINLSGPIRDESLKRNVRQDDLPLPIDHDADGVRQEGTRLASFAFVGAVRGITVAHKEPAALVRSLSAHVPTGRAPMNKGTVKWFNKPA